MASPQEYQNEFNKLDFGSFGTDDVTSSSDLRNLSLKAGHLKDHLWKLKNGIKSEISLIWEQYREESKDTIMDSFVAGFLGKKRSYKIRKRTREHLAVDRDRLIDSYRQVEAQIDEAIDKVNAYRSSIGTWAEALEAEEKRQKQSREYEQAEQRKKSKVRSHFSEKNPHYQKYIESKEWQTKAEEAKARVGNRCQVCNRSRAEVQLDAHHRTYERLGKELPEDITVLCRDCHQLYEDEKKAKIGSSNEIEPEKGFCIRCKTEMKLNPQSPYCYACFKVWDKYKNKDFREKYCHICGRNHMSTFNKPACYTCFKENRKNLSFQETRPTD